MVFEHHFGKKYTAKEIRGSIHAKESLVQASLAKLPGSMDQLALSCMSVFYLRAYLGDDPGLQALEAYVETTFARLRLAQNLGRPVSFTVKGVEYQVEADPALYTFVSPHTWHSMYWGASILQRADILAELDSMDLELLARHDSSRYPLLVASAVRAFHREDPRQLEILDAAIRDTSTLPADVRRVGWYRTVAPAILKLARVIREGDEATFQERLREALEAFKAYFAALQGSHVLAIIEDCVALPVCALTGIARRARGFSPKHESQYLPPHLCK